MTKGPYAPVPLVSVVVVNWNGIKVLDRCLTSLSAQTFQDFEIIVVDNGSSDGSVDLLGEKWPRVHLEKLPANRGFALANNHGARIAQGKWLALVNNDAFPAPEWLEELLAASEKNPEFSFFTSCLLMGLQPDRIDGMGDVYHISGLAWRRGHGAAAALEPQEASEVFGACAAAALFPKAIFRELGGFDEDYFCYHEDVDLSFRLRLAGHRCLYVPRARVEHLGSFSLGPASDFALYHGHRNLIWTFLKNMPRPLLGKYLPAHLLANGLSVLWFLSQGKGPVIWRAKGDALRALKAVLRKRTRIQQLLKVDPSEISRILDHGWIRPYQVAWSNSLRGRSHY